VGHQPRGFERPAAEGERHRRRGEVEIPHDGAQAGRRAPAGLYTHHLQKAKDGWRIKLQRVDMTNAQAAYDYVLQVWV
jgi:hypothetical protein